MFNDDCRRRVQHGVGGCGANDLAAPPNPADMRMFRKFHCLHLMNGRSLRRTGGFSMPEVLVVLVIILVLAALLFPLIRGLRERARSAQCVQNLRQIGVGLHGYIAENNGRFPNGGVDVSWLRDPETQNPLGYSWYDAAAKNLGREDFSTRFNDPSAEPLPEFFGCPSGHRVAYHPAWPYTGDYAGNVFLGNPLNPINPLTLAAVKNPSSTPYVQDTVKQNNFGGTIFSNGFSKTANTAFAARHAGKGNILWVDGHVSSLAYDAYMKFANDPKRGGVPNFIRGNW